MKKRPNNYWTEDRIKEESLKYFTPGAFQKGSKGAYFSAMRKGLLNKICSHMTIKTYWTDEMLQEEALKYNSRSSFRKGNNTAYHISHQRRILDKVCSHMEYLIKYWTDEMLKQEALKYDTRGDFQKKEIRAYTLAHKRGILNSICSHMDHVRTYWTDEMLQEEALKYKNRGEFQKNNPSAYILSCNRKIMDIIGAHMEPSINEPYTIEELREEASKYKSRNEFSDNNASAYNAVRRLNMLDEVCSHMIPSNGSSVAEKEIYEFVKYYYPNTVNGTRKIIPPLELDIYIPDISLAIEYNGLIWHCEKYQKGKDYHLNKTESANEVNTRLIHVFSDEWGDRKDQIKNYLLSVMGKNPINIGARKTDLKTVDKNEATAFLELHHIQGSAAISIAFGLYFKEELVGLMTGNKHHRQGQENILVLNRLVFKSGVSVQGGSSKLLKALISHAKNLGYSKLISWSDNRWSEGRVYEKMGFVLEENMGPDYSYVKGEGRISKQSCQKKHLIKRGAKGTMTNTEQELALSLGLYRIWDCGKKRWIMNLK